MSNLDAPWFNDPEAARQHLEAIRWPNGPVCPHCGNVDGGRIKKVEGKSHRAGLYACRECNGHFTATVGTVFERSHIPLNQWFKAVYFLCSSKKGMSAHQLHRTLGVTYKTAWFMAHRIREAMKSGGMGPLGGDGRIVEADETYFGKTEEEQPRRKGSSPLRKGGTFGPRNKRAVVSLVERGGNVRSFQVARADKATVTKIIRENIVERGALHTDESKLYGLADGHIAVHKTVTHSKGEYVRGTVHTNTVEGYFSIFKRGMKGVYQHCGERHLHRYLSEFDFRYNTRQISDSERTVAAMKGIEGKRLTYGGPRS